MPGTIKVSVLGFMDLPSSPSTISLTVSLGKKQYQALDKGDFSFSLTSVRDILVIVAGDVRGNEISRADIQAKSIVEKGYWDDHFALDGGGLVHMQLQFFLSQDERNRIRLMRESAWRKKQEEYRNMSSKSLGGASMARSNKASSFYLNPELSDRDEDGSSTFCILPDINVHSSISSHEQVLQTIDSDMFADRDPVPSVSFKENKNLLEPSAAVIPSEMNTSSSHDELPEIDIQSSDDQVDQQIDTCSLGDVQTNSLKENLNLGKPSESTVAFEMESVLLDDTVPLPSIPFEENKSLLEPSAAVVPSKMNTSLSPIELPEINIQSSDDQLVQKIDTCLFGKEDPVQIISLDENVKLSKPSEPTVAFETESSISHNADEEKIVAAEKPTPVKKTPSNVRKMISAFEGSQAQDMKPQTKVPLKKSQDITVSKEKVLADDQLSILKKEKVNLSSSGRETKSSVFEEPKYDEQKDVTKRDEGINVLQSLKRTKLLKDTQEELNGTALKEKLKDQPKEVVDSKDQPKQLYPRNQWPEENSNGQPTEVYATDKSKEINMKKETKPPELIETSKMEAEAATVSESVADNKLEKYQLGNSVNNPVNRSTREIQSPEITKEGVSNEEQYFSESSSGWIFPGDAIKLCITAGGKALANLVGDVGGSSSIHQQDAKISMEEHRGASGIKNSKAHPQNRKSISKGPEKSEGPLRQALKIAIVVGFGTLILLTRQGKKRNN